MTVSSYYMLSLQKMLSRSVGSILNLFFFLTNFGNYFYFFYRIEQLTLDDPFKKY